MGTLVQVSEQFNAKMLRTVVLISLMAGQAYSNCNLENTNPARAKDDKNYRESCIQKLADQVKMEFEASLQYMLMAAQFSQDTYNLPGVAGFFWASADEERGHGKEFISYLRMRGYDGNDFLGTDPIQPILKKYSWTSVNEALTDVLKMEKRVTASMKTMIDLCSQGGEDDPHAADWLTSTWLEEQLNGQRHLAGLINTLESFSRDHNELGEWMFDKEI